jgi:hypothetical protein
MKRLVFTDSFVNKRGKSAHRPGTIYNAGSDGLYFYGFDRIPRKLKKQAKSLINGNMIWVFSKPDKQQLKDPAFIWLECFKTLL